MLLTQGNQSGEQRQWNVVDTFSLSIGAHQLKFGIDYRRLFSYSESLGPYANYELLRRRPGSSEQR